MIDNKHIEWYFNYMKSREIISDGWIYDGFNLRDDKIIIRYYHTSLKGLKYSSYSLPKKTIITELRDLKLRQLFD